MSIYIRYLIATLFLLFISMFFWGTFIEASLFEISSGNTIIEGSQTNSGIWVLQLAISSIPVFVMLTTLLNRRNNIKDILVTSAIILTTGTLIWQARIVILNLKIKRINYLLSLADNDVKNSILMNNLLLEHYFFAGLVLGTVLINVYYYRNRKIW